MIENPYQSPNADAAESATPKHRSSMTVGTFRDAIKFSLIQQLPLLLLSALLLDGGLVFQYIGIAAVGFWVLTLIIMIRRGKNMPDSDILLVKWGYFPLLLATYILRVVTSAIGY